MSQDQMAIAVRNVKRNATGPDEGRVRTAAEREARVRRYYANLEAERAEARARMARLYERRKEATCP